MSDDQLSDEVLVEELRAGDMSAFERLYDRYEHRLYGYILRMMGEAGLAEDLFQDVFLTVLRDTSFDPERGRFAAWVFQVARNRCIGEMRRARTRKATTQWLGERARGLDHVPATAERDRRVWAALQQLPEGQRQLLMLKQVGELTYREIATLLDVAEGTVKSRLHGATAALRKRLASLAEES